MEIQPGAHQLFLDDALIESAHRVRRTWHRPVRHPQNPIVRPDTDDEKCAFLFGTVVFDPQDELFKMWHYSARSAGGAVVGYLMSEDGVCWRKPELGLYEIAGTKRNNVCLHAPENYYVELAGVIRNPRSQGDEDRWLMCVCTRRRGKSYSVLKSPDGLRWSEVCNWVPPQPAHPDRACFVWDPHAEQYALYCRTRQKPDVSSEWLGDNWWGRGVARTHSADLQIWSEPVQVMGSDAEDRSSTEIYSMMAWPYGDLWLGLPQTYRSRTDVACVDVQFAWSRDGMQWSRQREPPFIALGAEGEWDRFNQGIATRPVSVGDRLHLYYSGRTYRHGGYQGDDKGAYWAAIGLLTLRQDGWCSLDGSFDGAGVTTVPLRLPAGKLHLNAKADFGAVEVEVLDAAGQVLEGFIAAPLRQDAVDAMVEFPRSLASLAGRCVRLRFGLKNARLYAFWVE